MKASSRVIDLCLCLCVLLPFITAGFTPLKTPSCSLEKTEGGFLQCSSVFSYRETCKLPDGPRRGSPQSSSSFSSSSSSSSVLRDVEEEEEEEVIVIEEKVVTASRSVIDLNFPLQKTRRAAVVLSRRTHHNQERGRCVVVMVTAEEPGRVTLRDLTLQHGAYEVRVFKGKGGGMEELSHHFTLPVTARHPQRPRTLSRQRRHKEQSSRTYGGHGQRHVANQDLILQNLGQEDVEEEGEAEAVEAAVSQGPYLSNGGGGGGGGSNFCLCCKCFNFALEYDEQRAVLSFSYTLNSTCDSACSVVNVQLYRDNNSQSSKQCGSEEPLLPLKGVERIGMDKNVTEGPIRYRNVRRGCYFVELKPQMYRMPERTRPFWVTPAINVTNMDAWSTVFFLEPNPERRTMGVRWSVAERYNFTAYQLSLHHHPSLRINCTGKAIYPNMSIIPSQDRLVVSKPEYLFVNLSSGWYCARVTPQDDRCPLDGCQVLSSPARLLTEPVEWTCPDGSEECVESGVLGLSLLVVGCVLGAVVTGITVAWGLLHTWPTLSQVFSTAQYSPVPLRTGAKAGVGQRQVVLLVWTPQGPYGAHCSPIVAAFKTLLRTYGNCEVYDYLELSSLPQKQQLFLLSSPTAWLDSILANHSIKIIIVATEGAWQRQLEWKQLTVTPRKENGLVSTPGHAHDQILFPYLLRRLHDQPDLAGDYSRLFHVRFSDISHASVELTHIVSLTRYKIPEHLRSLAASLHGGASSASFEEPCDDQLTELRAALSSHPQFRGHSDTGSDPQWPGLVDNGHLAVPDVASGCVRSSEGSSSVASPVVNGSVRPDVVVQGSV